MMNYDLHIHSNFSDGHNSIDSIINAAIDKDIKRIAITDHMSAFGHFLFTFGKPVKPVESYLEEITKLRRKYKNQIHIYAGAEISQDFLNVPRSQKEQDKLQENLEYFSLFLIETTIIREPVLTAMNMRKYLNAQGFSHIPVILAHPAYSRMELATFKLLLNNNIGFELNENKFSQRHAAFFVDHVNALTPEEKGKLKISIGSDAHHLDDVGEVSFASQIIEQNYLWKYVITPPEVHDFLII